MSVVIQGDEIEPEIIVDFNDARHDMYVVTNGQVELWLKVCSILDMYMCVYIYV
jgi:signal-transduction protein with cAMP-binding, CBS, and nucleotidyltransferase domain